MACLTAVINTDLLNFFVFGSCLRTPAVILASDVNCSLLRLAGVNTEYRIFIVYEQRRNLPYDCITDTSKIST